MGIMQQNHPGSAEKGGGAGSQSTEDAPPLQDNGKDLFQRIRPCYNATHSKNALHFSVIFSSHNSQAPLHLRPVRKADGCARRSVSLRRMSAASAITTPSRAPRSSNLSLSSIVPRTSTKTKSLLQFFKKTSRRSDDVPILAPAPKRKLFHNQRIRRVDTFSESHHF
jgi:hypothetical protein